MREEGAQSDWDPPPGTAPVLGCALGGGLTFLAWTVVFVAAMGNANGDFSTPSWVFWAAFGVAIVADVIGLATLISRSAAETRAFAQVSTTGLVLSWAAWLTVNGAYFWMFATATSARGVQ